MLTKPRLGFRPRVSTEGPQRQLSEKSRPELWGQLVAGIFSLPGVQERHSQVSPPTSRGVFLTDLASERSAETSLAPGQRLEPVHVHGVDDTSIHVCLPAERGHRLTELGWAEPHQYGDTGCEFLIYGPRTTAELEVVLTIVAESLDFARGNTERMSH
ncbi:luciferase family protein [Cryobacterium sp. CG_9.6]|uniref:luciferase domain-containing protein n=1 Tax=Cryobacterium sp. CG_9.6 TaxID=2760710 RepID=UPI0024758B83|nr:luciferase family protein [Cryobacterium sp. CG_9.6]MDH6236785.1 hypothetical protein [Cryobacterium sp. CG_9.6]